METETRQCQSCTKEFTILPEDFNYYKKINVPPPTWCPECRMIRRMSCANSWGMFWRNCDKCGIRTLSSFSPDVNLKVYCQPCWWEDSWDGTEYGMDYNPSKSFFEQLIELSNKSTYSALESDYPTLNNCEYTNSIAYSKNCYMTIWADFCENVYYSSILNTLKWSIDCLRGWSSEMCYGSTSFIRNYRVFFSEECDDCVEVWFSRNCYSSTNCIGCVNLRGAMNCIFNVQYTKKEYKKKVKALNLHTWSGIEVVKEKAHKFWLTKPYREYHGHTKNLNVTGEYVYTSKNSKECFILNGAENCKWCQLITVDGSKDCMDYTGWGNNVELLYECVQVGDGASNTKFSSHCFPGALNTEYSYWSVSSTNNFGCINLKRKSYCILNKQYSKPEYRKLKLKIIKDMIKNPYTDKNGKTWRYGEFPSLVFGKFTYNKSNAMKFIPKTKEQAISLGYLWDDNESPKALCTIKGEDLPDSIEETHEFILEQIIECTNCKRGYKIVQGEFDLLRKMNLPIPHKCPKCREDERFERENKPSMYHRKCAKCVKNIYTPYSDRQPNIVYCVTCYQAEFL